MKLARLALIIILILVNFGYSAPVARAAGEVAYTTTITCSAPDTCSGSITAPAGEIVLWAFEITGEIGWNGWKGYGNTYCLGSDWAVHGACDATAPYYPDYWSVSDMTLVSGFPFWYFDFDTTGSHTITIPTYWDASPRVNTTINVTVYVIPDATPTPTATATSTTTATPDTNPTGGGGDPCGIYVSPVLSGTATPMITATPTPFIGPQLPTATPTYAPTSTPGITSTVPDGKREYLCNGSFENQLAYWEYTKRAGVFDNVLVVVMRKSPAYTYDQYNVSLQATTLPLLAVKSVEIKQIPVGGVIPIDAHLTFSATQGTGSNATLTVGVGDLRQPCLSNFKPQSTWTSYSCDLSAFAGRADPVVFRLAGGGALDNIFLDHISLQADSDSVPDLKEGLNNDDYAGFVYSGAWNVTGFLGWGTQGVHATTSVAAYVSFTAMALKCMTFAYTVGPEAGRMGLYQYNPTTLTTTLVLTIEQYSAQTTYAVKTQYCLPFAQVTTGRTYWSLHPLNSYHPSSDGNKISLDYVIVDAAIGVFEAGLYDDKDNRITYKQCDALNCQTGLGWVTTPQTKAYGKNYHTGASGSLATRATAEFYVRNVACLYLYTPLGPNRGKAEITVDDVVVGEKDLYNPVEWFPASGDVTMQANFRYCGLSDYLHKIQFTATLTKTTDSSGYAIALDALRFTADAPNDAFLEWGMNDDTHPGFTYNGIWEDEPGLTTDAYGGLTTRSTGGSGTITFKFKNAACFTWWYYKDDDKGIAEISVNGAVDTTIDLYAATLTVNSGTRYEKCGLSGVTTVTIAATSSKNASSTGYDIVNDAVEVHGGTSSLISGKVDDAYRGLQYSGTWAIDPNLSLYKQGMHTTSTSGAQMTFTTIEACINIGYHAENITRAGILELWVGGSKVADINNTMDSATPARAFMFYGYCVGSPYVRSLSAYTVTVQYNGQAANWGTGHVNVDWVEAKTYVSNPFLVTGDHPITSEWMVWRGAWSEPLAEAGVTTRYSSGRNAGTLTFMAVTECAYVGYISGPDRGMFTLFIDGVHGQAFDQYANTAELKENAMCGMEGVMHDVSVLTSAQRNPASNASIINIYKIKLYLQEEVDDGGGSGAGGCEEIAGPPTDPLDVSGYIAYLGRVISSFFSLCDRHTQLFITVMANRCDRDPFGTFCEFQDTIRGVQAVIDQYDASGTGQDSQGYLPNVGIFTDETNNPYNGDAINFSNPAGGSSTTACNVIMAGRDNPLLTGPTCFAINTLDRLQLLPFFQVFINVMSLLALAFYITKQLLKPGMT